MKNVQKFVNQKCKHAAALSSAKPALPRAGPGLPLLAVGEQGRGGGGGGRCAGPGQLRSGARGSQAWPGQLHGSRANQGRGSSVAGEGVAMLGRGGSVVGEWGAMLSRENSAVGEGELSRAGAALRHWRGGRTEPTQPQVSKSRNPPILFLIGHFVNVARGSLLQTKVRLTIRCNLFMEEK